MNNNDLMNMLMGALKAPEAKEKLTDILSALSPSDESPKEEAPVNFSLPPALTENADTVAKIKNMLDSFNRTDDNRIVLLNSIRPYMKPGREKNIDMAVKFIQLINFASGLR